MGQTNRRTLKRDQRGIFPAAVGCHRLPDGTTAKTRFSLGGELSEAERRLALIQQVWLTRGGQDQKQPGLWDEAALRAARRIANREQPPPGKYPFDDLEWFPPHMYAQAVHAIQEAVPVMKTISPPDPEIYPASSQALTSHVDQIVEQRLSALREELQLDLEITSQAVPDQIDTTTTHVALTAYQEDRVSTYVGSFQGREKRMQDIAHVIEVTPDLPLYRFRLPEIKAVINHYRQRPVAKHGKPCSAAWAKNQITEFKRGLRFIADHFRWSLPNIDNIDCGIRSLETDLHRGAIVDKHWTPKELREVFSPPEARLRAFFLEARPRLGVSAREEERAPSFLRNRARSSSSRTDDVSSWAVRVPQFRSF